MGFFSYMTQDTNRSIANLFSGRKVFTVTLMDDLGNKWTESKYEGYGEFGGKCIYELEEEMRERGTSPNLVEFPESWTYTNCPPDQCEFQGYFYPGNTKETAAYARKSATIARNADKKVTKLREAAALADSVLADATEQANNAKNALARLTGLAKTTPDELREATAAERISAKAAEKAAKKAAKAKNAVEYAMTLSVSANETAKEDADTAEQVRIEEEREKKAAKLARPDKMSKLAASLENLDIKSGTKDST